MINSQRSQEITWSKADLHLHTTYSDGLMTPAETIDIIAAQTDLRVLAITDHQTTEGAFIAREYAHQRGLDLEVIIGQEISTGEGDVLGLYLHSPLPKFPTAAAAIEAIHQQGGLAVAAHPFVFGWDMESVHTAILHLPFDAVEVWHGCPFSLPSNLWTALLNRLGQRLPGLGNSDSHIPHTAGQGCTWFPGRTEADLRRAIEHNMVRAGGPLWTPARLWQQIPILMERGWPTYSSEPKVVSYN